MSIAKRRGLQIYKLLKLLGSPLGKRLSRRQGKQAADSFIRIGRSESVISSGVTAIHTSGGWDEASSELFPSLAANFQDEVSLAAETEAYKLADAGVLNPLATLPENAFNNKPLAELLRPFESVGEQRNVQFTLNRKHLLDLLSGLDKLANDSGQDHQTVTLTVPMSGKGPTMLTVDEDRTRSVIMPIVDGKAPGYRQV
ncbi:MAG: hypothetical protein ACPGJO_10350 [bacterium]